MKVAITCHQMIRDLDAYHERFLSAGLQVIPVNIPGQHLEGQQLIRELHGCVGVIAGDDRYTREVMDHLPDLRVISKWGIGLDAIDLIAAEELGVAVFNTPGVFGDEVADVAFAYIVDLARQLTLIDRAIHDGSWFKPAGTSLKGSTLGIIGLGTNGLALARRALVAGMNVMGSEPVSERAEAARQLGVEVATLDSLLPKSDFISIHAPLTPVTHHLLNERTFGLMKQGVRLVNTSRGAIVDTTALLAALSSGRVSAAALDVFETEPLSLDDPLMRFDCVVFGSHNASNTCEASSRTHSLAINNLITGLERSTT